MISAPWDDVEGLFRPGRDLLYAADKREMTNRLAAVLESADLRDSLIRNGLETIRTRHTCAHRVDELLRHVSLEYSAAAHEGSN